MRFFLAALFFLVLPLTCHAAGKPVTEKQAAEKTNSYTFDDAFVRETPAHISAGYIVIHNPTKKADMLTSATADWAGRVELHTMDTDKNGVMQMKQIYELALPAGGALELRPGGMHMMIFEVKQPLRMNETVRITLVFRDAGSVTVPFKVRPLSYKGQ